MKKGKEIMNLIIDMVKYSAERQTSLNFRLSAFPEFKRKHIHFQMLGGDQLGKTQRSIRGL